MHKAKQFSRWLWEKCLPSKRRNRYERVLTAAQLNPKAISQAALSVVEGLHRAGYQAYLVGGAVRDLLLGVVPKDFDVATDARPEQIKRCFRRARIIGRRFQIVHVTIGREIVEVTTFRGGAASDHVDDQGRVLRDNQFGSLSEDMNRRDFTVNALYYDPLSQKLIDHHDGYRDIERRSLRMIGDPRRRYREDPVRMLRAVRLAQKLGLTIDPATSAPIVELAGLLRPVPAARRFDELSKSLLCGSAFACLEGLCQYGLAGEIMPALTPLFANEQTRSYLRQMLAATDERVAADQGVSLAFLLAALFWPLVNAEWAQRRSAGEHTAVALMAAAEQVLAAQSDWLAIPKRLCGEAKDIWSLQPRLELRQERRMHTLLHHPSLRAGVRLLEQRQWLEAELAQKDLASWWRRYADADDGERQTMMSDLKARGESTASGRRRRPRRAV